MSEGFVRENFFVPPGGVPWGLDEIILQVLLDEGPMSIENLVTKCLEGGYAD